MSQSSSTSGGESLGGGGDAGYDDLGSPVPYHVGPLSYEPAKLCDCRLKACRWISWSNAHPGRRYYRCSRARTKLDCKFYRWVDKECSDWYKELLGDLRDAVWKLKKDLGNKEAEVEVKEKQLVDKQMELDGKKKKVEEMQVGLAVKQQKLNAKEEELIAKQQQIEALQAKVKNQNQCIDALVVLCLLLVIFLVVGLLNAKKA